MSAEPAAACRLYIMAGSFAIARSWAAEQGVAPGTWVYLHRREQLLGADKIHLVKLRGWNQLSGIGAIDLVLNTRRIVLRLDAESPELDQHRLPEFRARTSNDHENKGGVRG